jgi:hypothetical protein
VRWQQTRAHDDQGHSAEVPRRDEVIWIARDPHDCEWTVAPHDDGTTWNLTRCSSWGEFIEGMVGFASADKAKAEAERRAADMVPG